MRKLALLLAAIVMLCSCERPFLAGYNETKTFAVGQFTKLDVENAINVIFTDEVSTVEATADANILPYLKVMVYEGTLKMKLCKRILINTGDITVKVPYQSRLDEVDLAGASSFESVAGLTADELSIDLSGASTFTASVSARKIDMELSGASKVFCDSIIATEAIDIEASGASVMTLTGTAPVVDAELSGASELISVKTDGVYAFSCNRVEAEFSGASKAWLHCNESINGRLSGGSMIRYTGNATGGCNCSGGSTVIHE